MGKQTRSHPVSLNVIRGAAEYSGFKLGRIRQNFYSAVDGIAKYTINVLAAPENCLPNPNDIRRLLNQAFARDCFIENVWVTPQGNWYAVLKTSITVVKLPPMDVEEAIRIGILERDIDGIPF